MQMMLHEGAGRHAADAFEVPCQMALIEEADFGGDQRAGHAGKQQTLCGGHTYPAQVAVRRIFEALAGACPRSRPTADTGTPSTPAAIARP